MIVYIIFVGIIILTVMFLQPSKQEPVPDMRDPDPIPERDPGIDFINNMFGLDDDETEGEVPECVQDIFDFADEKRD